MLLQLLLYFGITSCVVLFFFTKPSNVGTTVPVEKWYSILTKRLMSGRLLWRVTTWEKEVLHKTFGILSLFTACSMPCMSVVFNKTWFSIKSLVPVFTTSYKIVWPSHDIPFGPDLSHSCCLITILTLFSEDFETGN